MLSFKDQIILITGASRGIGAAAAIKFAEAGAAGIVINYHSNQAAAREVAQEVERRGALALTLKANVSMPGEAKALINQALERFGRLDVLVANAGIWPVEDKPIVALDEAQFPREVDLTLRPFFEGVASMMMNTPG